MNERKWHCVYTRKNCERKVSEQLKRKGFETYYPVISNQSRTGSIRRISSSPLFPTFVFIKLSEKEVPQVLRTDAVLSLVYWLGDPVIVRDTDIELMRSFIAGHSKVFVERIPISSKEILRSVSIPATKPELYAGLAFNNPVKITIPTLGYSITAEMELSSVEIDAQIQGAKLVKHYQLNQKS